MRTPLARKVADSASAAYTFASDLLLRPEQLVSTRFNSVVSAHRVFDTRRFMVEEFEAIRRLVEGATLNDAVLAVCGGALRSHLQALGRTARDQPERDHAGAHAERCSGRRDAAAVVAARAAGYGDRGSGAAPGRRSTRAPRPLRQTYGNGDDATGGVGQHAAAATLAMSGKMQGLLGLGSARHAPAASCTITNVAGPHVPLYLNGARMTYFSAIMPISDGMGLVFAVTSYDGRIIISPTSCRELLPDPEGFTQQLRDSFQEYLALARGAETARRPAR